jgi:hypothetical protein
MLQLILFATLEQDQSFIGSAAARGLIDSYAYLE